MADEVYVYGSNLAGRFVGETQRTAMRWYRADPGTREGPCGDSYAIALRDRDLLPLSSATIARNIARFLDYARANPVTGFYVPRFTLECPEVPEHDVAKCFAGAPPNCHLPGLWQQQLHPGVIRLLLVARWPELSGTDYELFYVWLSKYAKALRATPAGGLWCLDDPQARARLGMWASKASVPFYPLQADAVRYGQHAVEMVCAHLLTECTGILAMESPSASIGPLVERARHLGIATRLIRKVAVPAPEAPQKAQAQPVAAAPLAHTDPLRQPSPEDLQIYDPAGVYGTTGGKAPVRLARAAAKVDEHPFGRILEYVAAPA